LKHLLDIDIGDDGAVLLQGADIDLVRPARRIDGAEVLGGDEVDGIADGRIIGHAALKLGRSPPEISPSKSTDAVAMYSSELGWFSHDTSVIIAMMVVSVAQRMLMKRPTWRALRRRHLARRQKSDPGEEPRTEITRPKDVTVLNLDLMN
jgi:hypothetical protein